MKLRFRVIQVGWEIDLDDNRHPRIQMGRANWSTVVYDHPSEGWQVIALEIATRKNEGRVLKSMPVLRQKLNCANSSMVS